MGYELIFHLPYKACLHFIKITVQEMYRYKAVSYTHLDVYKRQSLIVYNGVYLLDPDSHDILYSHSFSRQDAQDILNYLLRCV